VSDRFLDTAYIMALEFAADQNHEAAIQCSRLTFDQHFAQAGQENFYEDSLLVKGFIGGSLLLSERLPRQGDSPSEFSESWGRAAPSANEPHAAPFSFERTLPPDRPMIFLDFCARLLELLASPVAAGQSPCGAGR
jgi:hypothetical protein